MTPGRPALRWRRRLRRAGAAEAWVTYLQDVEPALASCARAHRFAQVPIVRDASVRAAPLVVWIESGDEAAVARTRASLTAGSLAPADLLEGELHAALACSRAARVVLVRAGDELAPLALERLGQAVTLAPDAAVITCDEDELDAQGRRRAPRLRPGPSPDRWLACDDSGPLLLVARERAGPLCRELTSGPGWRHQLALALAGRASEHHAHVPLMLCHRAAVPRAQLASLAPREVQRLLARFDPAARVEPVGSVRRVRRAHPGEPSVEAIVCFRDRPELLARCVVSLLARTHYEHLALALVDNGSCAAETAELVRGLSAHRRVRVIRDPRPFHFAVLNNRAAASSSADVLVFLNNDTEVIDPAWVETLLEEALRAEVGAVAPLLLYPDGTIQHAGAALGLHGYAGHPFAGLAPDTETPFGRAAGGTRNWLAVTAACMMVQREKFLAAGGFDESFVVAGNDVDLCLRLTMAGHRSLCVPHAKLVHDESRSRGAHIDPGDFVASERSYGDFRTVGDPFYNPNLTLRSTDCALRGPAELR
ncbi:MAG: hypothetical protein DLM64_14015 [Solirubrobacterales bacterium]|nr:MAG: hypothetical protein DLM64_14015 [Solirubrobacterales bacterium]